MYWKRNDFFFGGKQAFVLCIQFRTVLLQHLHLKSQWIYHSMVIYSIFIHFHNLKNKVILLPRNIFILLLQTIDAPLFRRSHISLPQKTAETPSFISYTWDSTTSHLTTSSFFPSIASSSLSPARNSSRPPIASAIVRHPFPFYSTQLLFSIQANRLLCCRFQDVEFNQICWTVPLVHY